MVKSRVKSPSGLLWSLSLAAKWLTPKNEINPNAKKERHPNVTRKARVVKTNHWTHDPFWFSLLSLFSCTGNAGPSMQILEVHVHSWTVKNQIVHTQKPGWSSGIIIPGPKLWGLFILFHQNQGAKWCRSFMNHCAIVQESHPFHCHDHWLLAARSGQEWHIILDFIPPAICTHWVVSTHKQQESLP